MDGFYNIDPGGDVTIILRDADAPFAEAPALFGQQPDKPRTGKKKKGKRCRSSTPCPECFLPTQTK